MKLLLTSGIIFNKSITNALAGLLDKPFEENKVAFIPTAANNTPGDKGWLISSIYQFKEQGFASVDIIDISAIPYESWQPRIEEADLIVVGGGDQFYLMKWVRESGFDKLLPGLLETRVYVGCSAGSMITGKSIFAKSGDLYEEGEPPESDIEGLGFVDFATFPHFCTPEMPSDFPNINAENLRELARKKKETIYAIDDQSVIVVDGNKIEVVSEGKWEKFE